MGGLAWWTSSNAANATIQKMRPKKKAAEQLAVIDEEEAAMIQEWVIICGTV
jgi:hypothetical protein